MPFTNGGRKSTEETAANNYKIGDIVVWRPAMLPAGQPLFARDRDRADGTIGVVYSLIYTMPVVAWVDTRAGKIVNGKSDKASVYDKIAPAIVKL